MGINKYRVRKRNDIRKSIVLPHCTKGDCLPHYPNKIMKRKHVVKLMKRGTSQWIRFRFNVGSTHRETYIIQNTPHSEGHLYNILNMSWRLNIFFIIIIQFPQRWHQTHVLKHATKCSFAESHASDTRKQAKLSSVNYTWKLFYT